VTPGERKGDFLAGKYLLEDCLGIGGMGEVYRATNVSLGRKVAIKILSADFVNIESDVLRFLREARAAATIRHPNVVDVIDVARDDQGTPFIVQELLSGEDLEHYLRARGGKLPIAEALEIMAAVADAVAAAHAQRVVHRDLKPANIFLARDRDRLVPKVLDFGACLFPTIAERSAKEVRMLIGTPQYMAPEQIVSKADVDARSDVWALGVILYELLTGHMPFEASDMDAVLELVKTRDVPRLRERLPDAPDPLERIIVRCTTRDRLARYPDASALCADLRALPRVMATGRDLLRLSSPDSDAPPPNPLSSLPPPREGLESLPPVLDPRAAGTKPRMSVPAPQPRELPQPPEELARPSREADDVPRMSAPNPPLPKSVAQLAPRPQEEWSMADTLKFSFAIALPAIGGFIAVLAIPALGGPVGRALRGDSTFASGTLAVVALLAAAGLCARTIFGESNRWQKVAAAGSVLFAIAMIIVTFSASEAAELGVPASMGNFSTLVAPIAPLALGLGALARARATWVDRYAQSEARLHAAFASVMLFLVLALSPMGAVRSKAAAGVVVGDHHGQGPCPHPRLRLADDAAHRATRA
jgi:serine/threonine-protein kinase